MNKDTKDAHVWIVDVYGRKWGHPETIDFQQVFEGGVKEVVIHTDGEETWYMVCDAKGRERKLPGHIKNRDIYGMVAFYKLGVKGYISIPQSDLDTMWAETS